MAQFRRSHFRSRPPNCKVATNRWHRYWHWHVHTVQRKLVYDYIIVRNKSQLMGPQLATLPPPVIAKQRVVIIPRDQPEEGIDGYGGKDWEKES